MKSIIGEIAKNGVTAPNDDYIKWVQNEMNIMDDTISSAMEKGGALWRQKYGGIMQSISTKCINKVAKDVFSKRLPTTP
jgi:hypothetical protein